MQIKKIDTKVAPKAIGPYSQAKQVDNILYLSGQIALDPNTGKLIGDTSIEAQTQRIMKNLKAVLTAAQTDFEHVLKTTIYLIDLNDYKIVNKIYGSYFNGIPPARSTVEVSSLPLDVSIEIDMIAVIP